MLVRFLKKLTARRVGVTGPGGTLLNERLQERQRVAFRGGEHRAGVNSQADTATVTDPSNARAWSDMGLLCQQSGRSAEALTHYARAVELDPGDARSWNNLGVLQWESHRHDDARSAFRNALKGAPLLTEALRNLLSCKLTEEDERLVRRIRSQHPQDAHAAAAMGVVLMEGTFDTQAALQEFDRALELGLSEVDLHLHRGIALQDLGRVDEAVESYDRALELDAANVKARWHRALALLLTGRYQEAWEGYEERLRQVDPAPRRLPFPRWQGQPLPDGTLLIHAEQGLGDEIMFGTCIREAMTRAGRCVIDCHPKLARLFARAFPDALIHAGLQTDPLEWVHQYAPTAHIPSGSLPRLFRPTPEHFPSQLNYLEADTSRRLHWRSALDQLGPGVRIGLSWRGGTARSRSAIRSIDPIKLLGCLAARPIHLVNLQHDADDAEVKALSAKTGVTVHHWRDALEDYEDTAALVSELDLVLTVCTAIVHLGGALGVPVWVLAPLSPEWRYGATGERMPWYPSVRVFRQPAYRDWDTLLQSLGARVDNECIGDRA